LLLTGKVKFEINGAEAKASPNRAISQWGQTRNFVIYPWAG
jgi:hypothetical protein